MSRPVVQPYHPRPIRFLGVEVVGEWRIKAYSISVRAERIDEGTLAHVRTLLPGWLAQHTLYPLATYRVATLIVHEARDGCFAIVSWWIDSNMLQTFVHHAADPAQRDFRPFSDRGIFTCVWEMGVLWFERNAWVEHVLSKPGDVRGIEQYLAQHLNTDL